jgi:nucleoside 2-deoxyribosyltransferase
MPAPRVYVASPYGFSAATRAFAAALLGGLRDAGLEPVDPWADPGGSIADEVARIDALPGVAEQRAAYAALDARLGDANIDAIADPATRGVLAVLDGTDVDSGVAAEVGWAAALGKPVVGIRFDGRLASENPGTVVNLQVQRVIERSGGEVRRHATAPADAAFPAAAIRDAALALLALVRP